MARKPNLDAIRNREVDDVPYRSGKKDYQQRELDAYHDDIMHRNNLGDLYVNLKYRPSDKVYSWVIKYTLGQERLDIVHDHLSRGWTPVPKTRHPELGSIDPKIAEKLGIRTDDSIVEKKGLILCERDIELQKVEDNFWMSQGRDRYKSTMKMHHNRNIDMDDPMQPRVLQDTNF